MHRRLIIEEIIGRPVPEGEELSAVLEWAASRGSMVIQPGRWYLGRPAMFCNPRLVERWKVKAVYTRGPATFATYRAVGVPYDGEATMGQFVRELESSEIPRWWNPWTW